ncbi:hypothetical protein NDU88_003218 [Pleurodeles waltl]|uniref:Uncharacterized protein n=1 Tax=Pleurodeles waltl TaxID=8319 RepID=A0AAV7WU54_PLEWA|nr:hypothetical protein NDU88_003218 [Pleurodeles waltl]
MVSKTKREISLLDMLMIPAGTPKGVEEAHWLDMGQPEGTVVRTFLEALFSSLQEDLQAVKRYLSPDLREVQKDLDEVGERVASLQRKDDD